MADSDNTMSLSAVTRREVLTATAIAIAAPKGGTFGRKTLETGQITDPAVSAWQKWRAAHDHTEYLCRHQQLLERKLVQAVGFPRSKILLRDGKNETLHSLEAVRDALDLGQEDLSIRAKAEADLKAHQARWDAADREIGYSEALRAECEAANRTDQLLEMLSVLPAASLAGVAAKLDAVLTHGQASKDDDEFPWPQIRSALEDIVRIGRPKRTELGPSFEGTQRAARPLGTIFGKESGAEKATEAYRTAMRDCGDFDDPCPDSGNARPQQGRCDEDNAEGCWLAGRGQSLVSCTGGGRRLARKDNSALRSTKRSISVQGGCMPDRGKPQRLLPHPRRMAEARLSEAASRPALPTR
ncbi:hypothetical protein NKJ95_23735 [Mesorhizobium sp. M0012]|uniref:hypothetical protein n=1 Tax=Mesorhizobium sp. M0012 TaxID=2956840 RepID=UPI003334DAF9